MGTACGKNEEQKERERCFNFQLNSLENCVINSDEEGALVWISRILRHLESDKEALVFQRVFRFLVRLVAREISPTEDQPIVVTAAAWVSVRDGVRFHHFHFLPRETLAIVTILLCRAEKSRLVREAFEEARAKAKTRRRGAASRWTAFTSALMFVRRATLRSDLQDALYWLAVCLRYLPKQWLYFARHRAGILYVASYLRAVTLDYIDEPEPVDVLEAVFSVFDYSPEVFDPCGGVEDYQEVLAFAVVVMAKSPKINHVATSFKHIQSLKKRLASGAIAPAQSLRFANNGSEGRISAKRRSNRRNRMESLQASKENQSDKISLY